MKLMPPRIAIPMPHSTDPDYAERAIPQYERAVQLAGGEPVRIPLNQTPAEIKKIIANCDAVLLPGSKADVDPASYKVPRSPHTAEADTLRTTADELLLQDAYSQRKPIFGICYGLQSLNVFRGGSLIQHIPDFLPENLRTRVNHEAGGKVAVAHTAEIETNSKLAEIIADSAHPSDESRSSDQREGHGFSRADSAAKRNQALALEANGLTIPVNSSHHQSAATLGQGLRQVALCPGDGIIEALEGTAPDHFVIAVQWHPERSFDHDEPSRALFRAFIDAAAHSS
jgi:putative glutamine amidotransferase